MKLFKTKAEKEQERRMLVKKAMRELEKRIVKLKEQEAVYVKAGQLAMREELPDQLKLAQEALKMTMSERKRTYKMYLNAQIILQMRDMTAMTSEFLNSIHVISKDIAGITGADMSKITSDMKIAIDKVSQQTEDLGEMLEESQEHVGEFSAENSLVTDDEVQKLFFGAGAEQTSNASIDSELEALKKKLEE